MKQAYDGSYELSAIRHQLSVKRRQLATARSQLIKKQVAATRQVRTESEFNELVCPA